jgi:hypothetical protein
LIRIQRFPANPLIRPDLHPSIGANINGPSLIRVPDWLSDPLGRYYLYFAHHQGSSIRLAYADRLEGPWRIYAPGTLQVGQTPCSKHIASPDVHVDAAQRQIRLYFHGPLNPLPPGTPPNLEAAGQYSFAALSSDGLHFVPRPEVLGAPYFRVFHWRGLTYALGMPGIFYRSRDGLSGFEQGPTLFSRAMRHTALQLRGETLYVYYSNAGDCPERILRSTIDLSRDWMEWQASAPQEVIHPEMDYEGAGLPCLDSRRGWAPEPVHQLRDPGIFEEDGRTYLLYSIAGEAGIAAAEVLD